MTDSQHDDGYAWTWEPATGALTAAAIVAVVALQTGRTLALAIAGSGWHWPPSTTLVTSTGGILTGDLGAGLTPVVWGDPVIAWTLAGIVFTLTFTAAVVVAVRWVAARRHKGMATAAHAEQLLGLGRLRATRAVIRPDLHPRHRS